MPGETITCPHCERSRPARFRTDGFGGVVDESPPCDCDTSRRKRGVCRDCDQPVEGQVGKAVRCAVHKKEAQLEASRRYRERHPKRYRATQKRQNRKRRTEEGRARRRLYERERRKTPEGQAAIRRKRRKRSLRGKTAEEKRRYKERYPERVKAQQRRANRKRAKEKREYMHRYATKYVGPGKAPTCEECGEEVPWTGRGRPMKKCEDCDPKRWEAARKRAEKRAWEEYEERREAA